MCNKIKYKNYSGSGSVQFLLVGTNEKFNALQLSIQTKIDSTMTIITVSYCKYLNHNFNY